MKSYSLFVTTPAARHQSSTPPRRRSRWVSLFVGITAAVLSLVGASSAIAQGFGPGTWEANGVLVYFAFSGPSSDGTTWADYYLNEAQYANWQSSMGFQNGGGWTIYEIDYNGNVCQGATGTYTPGSGFSGGNLAIASDGGFSPPPNGVQVVGGGVLFDGSSYWWADYSFATDDGSNTSYSLCPQVPVGDCFQIGSSPWYQYQGGLLSIDPRNGWPAGILSAPPQQIYVNGEIYNITTNTSVGGVQSISENIVYTNPNTGETAGINCYYTNGAFTGDVWGYAFGTYFSGSFNPNTWAVAGISSEFAVTFSAPSGYPTIGPPYISWNGILLLFSYTDSQGTDYYADSSGTYLAQISSGDEVTVSSPSYATSGMYNPASYQFSFGGDSNMTNFFAQDPIGNPLGLPTGVTLLFGSSASGQAIMEGNGTSASPTYTYRRPDGSWGLKYVGLPDGPLLVQDSSYAFTSPVYLFKAANGECVINGISGWPQSNLYPSQLYVSGVLCTLDPSSKYDSGGSPPGRAGGATYYPQGNQFAMTLSWVWNSQFQGSVQISYGTSGSYSGTWDGMSSFGGLPATYVVTTTPPSGGSPPAHPLVGPAQILSNGVPFNFAASASGIFNFQDADVYQSASGAQVVINPNGTVTLTRKDGSQVSGIYNSSTQQFDFGANDVGVISANNSAGQTLNTVISGGQTTEITGGLDVQGNFLTLGSWINGSGSSVNALTLTYTDTTGSEQPSLLNFNATRAAVNWLWSSAVTDGSSTQVPAMLLDSSHQVSIYGTTGGTNPTIVLDPAGVHTGFAGAVRIAPQGDISMGTFTTGPLPPSP